MSSGLSVLGGIRVLHVERSLKQVFCKGVYWVLWLLHADVLEPLGQEEDQVVLQVHSDVLRLGVEHVLLGFTEQVDILLGLLLFLLANNSLQVFLLLLLSSLLQFSRC